METLLILRQIFFIKRYPTFRDLFLQLHTKKIKLLITIDELKSNRYPRQFSELQSHKKTLLYLVVSTVKLYQ